MNITSGCPNVIEVQDRVAIAMKAIVSLCPVHSSGGSSAGGMVRMQPLVLSRLGRGGKTTMLHIIYHFLKEQG